MNLFFLFLVKFRTGGLEFFPFDIKDNFIHLCAWKQLKSCQKTVFNLDGIKKYYDTPKYNNSFNRYPCNTNIKSGFYRKYCSSLKWKGSALSTTVLQHKARAIKLRRYRNHFKP